MAPPIATTATAVKREAAWLKTSGDGLPGLLESAGGPFDIVQAYLQRTPPEVRSLYVLRSRLVSTHFAAVRRMPKYRFLLRVVWPIRDPQGEAEDDQQLLDDAVELVLARITGFTHDKTHGGRFLSVGETDEPTVVFADPARTMYDFNALTCDITYGADDYETVG